MSHELTQPSLLIRVRDPHDHVAWDEFDRKYRNLILGYCRARGVQESDAEDVRQMVMMNLSKFLRNFEYEPGKGKFRYYLCRTVRNAISQLFARQKAAEQALDTAVLATVPAAGEPESDDAWENEWVAHHFRLAMQTIRATFEPRSVDVFEKLLAGESPEAVAVASGLNAAAVYKIKQRIRDRMKELIDEQVRDEDEPRG